MTANVEAINHKTREVTLRGPEGNTVSFVASEEARNLDQVSVGDTVKAEYEETLSIELFANDGIEPNAGQLTAAGRSEKGEMPAGAIVNAQVVTATVEEINLEKNTFKLKGPSGEVTEHVARNPENLKKAAEGGLVMITYTEAVAISVEKTSEEVKKGERSFVDPLFLLTLRRRILGSIRRYPALLFGQTCVVDGRAVQT